MKRRWETKTIEITYSATTPENDQQILEQTGGILYSYLCQLGRKSISTETTAAASSIERRTSPNG